MAAVKTSPRKPAKPLGVKKAPLSDLPAKDKGAAVKGGRPIRGAPPYVPVGPGSSNY